MAEINVARFQHAVPCGERARIAPHINRSELERAMGIGRAHLSRIMSGRTEPGVKTLKALATALGTGLDGADKFLRALNGGKGGKSDKRG